MGCNVPWNWQYDAYVIYGDRKYMDTIDDTTHEAAVRGQKSFLFNQNCDHDYFKVIRKTPSS